VHLTYFYRLGYLYAENSQIWLRFDEVLTKTSWVIFGTPCSCTHIWRWNLKPFVRLGLSFYVRSCSDLNRSLRVKKEIWANTLHETRESL